MKNSKSEPQLNVTPVSLLRSVGRCRSLTLLPHSESTDLFVREEDSETVLCVISSPFDLSSTVFGDNAERRSAEYLVEKAPGLGRGAARIQRTIMKLPDGRQRRICYHRPRSEEERIIRVIDYGYEVPVIEQLEPPRDRSPSPVRDREDMWRNFPGHEREQLQLLHQVMLDQEKRYKADKVVSSHELVQFSDDDMSLSVSSSYSWPSGPWIGYNGHIPRPPLTDYWVIPRAQIDTQQSHFEREEVVMQATTREDFSFMSILSADAYNEPCSLCLEEIGYGPPYSLIYPYDSDERAADERAADERAADERAADERAADLGGIPHSLICYDDLLEITMSSGDLSDITMMSSEDHSDVTICSEDFESPSPKKHGLYCRIKKTLKRCFPCFWPKT